MATAHFLSPSESPSYSQRGTSSADRTFSAALRRAIDLAARNPRSPPPTKRRPSPRMWRGVTEWFATQSTSQPCAVRRTHWLPLLVPSAKTSNIDGAKQRAYRRPSKHQRKLRILPRYGDTHAGSPARPRPAGTLRERLPGLRALEAETNRRKELYSFKASEVSGKPLSRSWIFGETDLEAPFQR